MKVSELKSKLAAGVACIAVLAATSVGATEWRGWNIHVEEYPNTIAMDKFAELLAEKTGGEITLNMFHGGTLGSHDAKLWHGSLA